MKVIRTMCGRIAASCDRSCRSHYRYCRVLRYKPNLFVLTSIWMGNGWQNLGGVFQNDLQIGLNSSKLWKLGVSLFQGGRTGLTRLGVDL